jgi:acyl-CoA dehydrogenase
LIDFQPTEEQQLIVETVRQFAANELRPIARTCSESREIPAKVLSQAHELGLIAGSIDASHGGGGERSAVTGCLIAEELACADLALALAILSPSLIALAVDDLGSESQKSGHLAAFTASRFVPGALAVVEPHMRSDPLAPHTRARASNGDFRLDGTKCFVPWIEDGTHVIVIAAAPGGPRPFLIPRDAAGLTTTPERNMGIDALPTVELRLEDVCVPATSMLGPDDDRSVRSLIDRGRVGLAATAVGVARAAYEVALDYAKEREAFGSPIATKQAIAFKLADMAIEIDGARLLVWEAAWKLDRGDTVTREATLAYAQVQRVALEVADGAVQVLGGHGYIREYLPELHLRNARGFASFEALTLV